MQEAASMQDNISEVLGDLNITSNPYSYCTNIIGPEIAVAGQEPMAIGLLVSALDRRPSRAGKMFRAPEHVVRQKLMPGMGSASLRRRGLSFAFPFTVVTRPQPEPEIGDRQWPEGRLIPQGKEHQIEREQVKEQITRGEPEAGQEGPSGQCGPGPACRRPAASCVRPPSRGSRPNTPATSATNSHAVHDPALGRRRRPLCSGARSARSSGGLAALW
jgi:hypothetical protein